MKAIGISDGSVCFYLRLLYFLSGLNLSRNDLDGVKTEDSLKFLLLKFLGTEEF